MAIEALQNEMALVHRRTVEFFDALLLETLQTRPKYWQTPDGLWALSDWLLDVSETDPDRCFLRNFFLEAAEVRPIVDQLLETRMSTDQPATEMAVKLVRRGEEPIGNRILGYVIWRLRGGDLDPIQFFQDCRQDSRLVMLSGLMWGVQDFVENWDQELKRLSRRAEKEEGVEWAEEEEPEGPVVITPADLEEVYKVLRKKKAPQSAAALAEAIYEFSPSSRRFQESVDAVDGRAGARLALHPGGAPDMGTPGDDAQARRQGAADTAADSGATGRGRNGLRAGRRGVGAGTDLVGARPSL